MIILGIDPGTGRTGWGVIRKLTNKNKKTRLNGETKTISDMPTIEYVAHGCIVTTQDKTMQQRLHELHTQMLEIIQKFKPDCIAIEHIFFGRNVKTAISVGQARGVIMLSAVDLPMYEYTGIAVKHSLSGHGRTEKKDIQIIVRTLLKEDIARLSFNTKDKGFDDAADALAIALHHIMKISEYILHPKEKVVKRVKKEVQKKVKETRRAAGKKKSSKAS